MPAQGGGIADARAEHGGRRAFLRLHNTYDGQCLTAFDQTAQIVAVARLIPPEAVFAVVNIVIRAVYQLEGNAEKILIRIALKIRRSLHRLVVGELPEHLLEFERIPQAQRIERKIADAPPCGEHHDTFVVVLRPASGHNVILILIKPGILRHFKENVRVRHGRQQAACASGAKSQHGHRLIRVDLPDSVRIAAEDLRGNIVKILHRARIILNPAVAAVEVTLQRSQIVRVDMREHAGDHLIDGHPPVLPPLAAALRHIRHQHGGRIDARALNLQGILRKRILFHGFYVIVHAVGQRQDQRNAYDADGTGKCSQQRARFFRAQILEAECQRGEDRHGCLPQIPVNRRLLRLSFRFIGHGIRTYDAVL